VGRRSGTGPPRRRDGIGRRLHRRPLRGRRYRGPQGSRGPDLAEGSCLEGRAHGPATDLETQYAEQKLRLEADLHQVVKPPSPSDTACSMAPATSWLQPSLRCSRRPGSPPSTWTRRSATLNRPTCLSQGAQRRLVEVKAASGPAQESLVGYLQRHLDTCPQLRSDQPVSGGILVITISTNITR
jgi:hypothetical protein